MLNERSPQSSDSFLFHIALAFYDNICAIYDVHLFIQFLIDNIFTGLKMKTFFI